MIKLTEKMEKFTSKLRTNSLESEFFAQKLLLPSQNSQ